MMGVIAGLTASDYFVPTPKQAVTTTACSVVVDTKRIDKGTCTVNTNNNTTVFVDDDKTSNGYCAFTFTRTPRGVMLRLWSYRGPCPVARDDYVTTVTRQQNCWTGSRVRVCVAPKQ